MADNRLLGTIRKKITGLCNPRERKYDKIDASDLLAIFKKEIPVGNVTFGIENSHKKQIDDFEKKINDLNVAKSNEEYEFQRRALVKMAQELEKILLETPRPEQVDLGRRSFVRNLAAGLFGLTLVGQTVNALAGGTPDYEAIARQMEEWGLKDQNDQVIKIGEKYERDPENRSALFFNELGLAHGKKKDFPKAKHYLEKSLSIHSNDPSTNFNLGFVYGKLGDKQKAIHYLKRTLELKPDHNNAKIWLEYYQK